LLPFNLCRCSHRLGQCWFKSWVKILPCKETLRGDTHINTLDIRHMHVRFAQFMHSFYFFFGGNALEYSYSFLSQNYDPLFPDLCPWSKVKRGGYSVSCHFAFLSSTYYVFRAHCA